MDVIEAKEVHIPEIVEIWKEFMDFHRDLDRFYTRCKEGHVNFEQYLNHLILSDDALLVVAIDGGEVIGYSIAELAEHPPVLKNGAYGLIMDMAVRKGHRGGGVGQAMFDFLSDWFDKKGIRRIELKVAAGNIRGESFWKKQGFKDYMHMMYLDR